MIWENLCIGAVEYLNCSTRSGNRVPKSPSGKKRTDQFQIYSPATLISNQASATARKKPPSALPSCLLKLQERQVAGSCCPIEILDTPRVSKKYKRHDYYSTQQSLSFYINRENNSSTHFRVKEIYSRVESDNKYRCKRNFEGTSQLAVPQHPRRIPKAVDRCEMSIIVYTRAWNGRVNTRANLANAAGRIKSFLAAVQVSPGPSFLPASQIGSLLVKVDK